MPSRGVYAISTGVGSAREIARLVRTDDAYRWIVGDLEVSHHALSAFRVGHGAALDVDLDPHLDAFDGDVLDPLVDLTSTLTRSGPAQPKTSWLSSPC
jgi:hypothetical protein